jgi:hypothetical protein
LWRLVLAVLAALAVYSLPFAVEIAGRHPDDALLFLLRAIPTGLGPLVLLVAVPLMMILRSTGRLRWWTAMLVGGLGALIAMPLETGRSDIPTAALGGLSGLVFWCTAYLGLKRRGPDKTGGISALMRDVFKQWLDMEPAHQDTKRPDHSFEPAFWLLFGAGLFVSLIACLGWDHAFDLDHLYRGRGALLNGWDPISRFAIRAGGASCVSYLAICLVTIAFRRSVGRVSEDGITVLRLFRTIYMPWADLAKAQFRRRNLQLTARHELGTKAKITEMYPTSMSKQDVLAILARYRPDLFPGVEPSKPPVHVPQEQIVINSRQWTG